MLESKGIKSALFTDGFKALSCFQMQRAQTCCRRSFKLVLTDIQMPQIDGYQVSERIKATEKYHSDYLRSKSIECFVKARKKCPVIAVTANHDNTVGELAFKSGIKEVLLKPVDI